MGRIIFAALLVSSGLAAAPATAQYHRYYDDDEYDYRPRRGREYEYRDYDRRRDYGAPRRGYSGPPAGGPALGATCATPRGACSQTPAQPRGSSCVCFVVGAGNTPGTVR
jgi:hypothetical protein